MPLGLDFFLGKVKGRRGQPIMTPLPGLPRFEGRTPTLFVTFLILCVTNNALCQVLNGAAYGMTINSMLWGRFDKIIEKSLEKKKPLCVLHFRPFYTTAY